MSFDRWKSLDKYSYAFKLFRKYHTYMNSLYWVHVPASDYIQHIYRKEKSNPLKTTHSVYKITGKNAVKVPA